MRAGDVRLTIAQLLPAEQEGLSSEANWIEVNQPHPSICCDIDIKGVCMCQ